MKPACAVFAMAAALVQQGTLAQTVFRCGPGASVYQQEPCPAGQSVDVGDARSEEQRKAARAAAKDDAKLEDTLVRERRAREAAQPARATGFDARPVPAQTSASAPKKAKRHNKPKAEAGDARHIIVVEPGVRAGKTAPPR